MTVTTNSPANSVHFAQPHWKLIARGFSIEDWFDKDRAIGNGGINMPCEVTLPAGHYYYRFACSRKDRDSQLGGGWWLEAEQFLKISRFAQQNGYRLKDAARLMLALPDAWTRVDLLYKALLLVPMLAYRGRGKPAIGYSQSRDKADSWTPMQHIQVQQLYIPGLYVRPDREKRTYKSTERAQLYYTVFEHPPICTELR